MLSYTKGGVKLLLILHTSSIYSPSLAFMVKRTCIPVPLCKGVFVHFKLEKNKLCEVCADLWIARMNNDIEGNVGKT